jgi:hypothetical protein
MGPDPDPDADPDPAIFVMMPTKTNFFLKVFCLLLFQGTFTLHFLKIKSQKAVGINVLGSIFAWG